MAIPRRKVVKDGAVGVYHCTARCVRQAHLCGVDPLTGKDYRHRKARAVDQLRFLARLFTMDVCAFALMINHLHTVLRTRPDLAETLTALEVAWRWLTARSSLFGGKEPTAEAVAALAARPERIEVLRGRLSSVSWFMAMLDEYLARTSNREDGVKGRFWEGRFQCRALLDVGAVATAMAYVDLNPVRAGLAETPEESEFTSIRERILAWREDETAHVQVASETKGAVGEGDGSRPGGVPRVGARVPGSGSWLCPIRTTNGRQGILPLTEEEYWRFVDATGRVLRPGKKGHIDEGLAPILNRLGIVPDPWPDTVNGFGHFPVAVGSLSRLRQFARDAGRRWLHGFRLARSAFSEG